jgi:hypothetical protein
VFHQRSSAALIVLTLALALGTGALSLPGKLTDMAADAFGGQAHAQQPETRIGVDADSSGNTDLSLGTIDDCVVIGEGESHTVDIFVENVNDLLAWEAVLTFEPLVLQVVDADVSLFMAANAGSDVQDVSGALPDSDGRYWLQAFDAADPPAPDSGSGVLARVTVKGVGPGVSQLDLPLSDLDGDGKPDEGPLLRDVDVNSIGDENGDTLFDGPIAAARIAVDASCSDPLGPANPGSGGGEEGSVGLATVLALVIGFPASLAVGGLAAVWAVRRRPAATGQ